MTRIAAAERLGLSPRRVSQLVEANRLEIETTHCGRSYLISAEDVERLRAERSKANRTSRESP